jgi:hypothetical protein
MTRAQVSNARERREVAEEEAQRNGLAVGLDDYAAHGVLHEHRIFDHHGYTSLPGIDHHAAAKP